MSSTDQTTDQVVEKTEQAFDQLDPEPTLTIGLALSEAEALRVWLLKPASDGSTSLDDPLVSRALATLGRAVDTLRATVNLRHELQQAGLEIDHLSDEQLHTLGRRVTEAVSGLRD
jgi:hypothetical protein